MQETDTTAPFDWTRGLESQPVPCLNEIDRDLPPLVEYCREVRVSEAHRARIAAASQMPCCDCEGTCQPSSCTCRIAYSSAGLLLDLAQPVLECHDECTCDTRCVNRQLARGPHRGLVLRKTRDKGWALSTCAPIRAGAFVVEYTGELISTQETQRRFMNYDSTSVNYLLVLREWSPSQNSFLRTNIDATHCGNIARFMNHSCAPNCVLVPVRGGTIVPRAALFALREICAGEELCFDYGVGDAQVTGVKCQCAAPNCRGWLPRDSSV